MSTYGIDIVVSPQGAVSGSRTATRSLNDIEKAGNSAEKSVGGLNVRMLAIAATAAAVATAISAATRELASQADQVDRLNVRLSRHTSSMGETISVYSELRDVSTATRTSLEDNIALFDRFAAIGPELGKSNEEITAFVEQLVKLGALSGSSAEEQANALRQLAQGLAAGTLRAEEFNSIVEQAPEILRVVARESGRTFGQLRQDMLDGKITAELLFESIAKGADTTDAQFSKFKATTDELFTTAAALARDAAAALGEVSGAQAAWNATAQFTVEIMAALARELDSMRDTPKTIDGLALRMGDLRSELADLQRIQAEQSAKFGGVGIVDALLGKSSPEARIAEVEKELKQLEKVYADARGLSAPGPAKEQPQKATIVDPTAGKAIEALRQQVELSKLQGEARARLAAIQKLGASATAEERAEAEQLATQIYRLDEAQKAATKSASEQAKSAEEVKRQQEANAETVAKLREQLNQASLKGAELAARQAELSLNEYATQQQVEQVRQLATAISDLEDRKRLADEAEQIRRQTLTGPEQMALQYQQQQAILQQALDTKAITEQQYYETSAALNRSYNEEIAKQEAAANSARLQAGAQLFGGLAGLAETFAGEQSGLYKAMFAASQAFAIADAIIKIQQGIANAAALPFPANLAAMGTVAAATGSIVSTISGTQMQGFQSGGYTGDMGVGTVAGVVHGQEYVMNAQATRRIGVDNLERMASGGSMGGGVSVQVYNNAPGVRVQTEQIDENTVRLIINEELDNQFSTRMTGELGDSYSDSNAVLSSRFSIQRNTTR
ncbi:MAG: tape measure protein [Aeromonadaceae bacterium]